MASLGFEDGELTDEYILSQGGWGENLKEQSGRFEFLWSSETDKYVLHEPNGSMSRSGGIRPWTKVMELLPMRNANPQTYEGYTILGYGYSRLDQKGDEQSHSTPHSLPAIIADKKYVAMLAIKTFKSEEDFKTDADALQARQYARRR